MVQVLHGSATTTEAIRRAIQESSDSVRTLARRHGVNPKTVAKWKNRGSTADLPSGPRRGVSFAFSPDQEAIAVAFRAFTILPLDACVEALSPTMPHLTRSSLHRCFQRHGVSRTSAAERAKAWVRSSPGRLSLAAMRIEEADAWLIVAVDRHSGFSHHELLAEPDAAQAHSYVERLLKAVACKVSAVALEPPPMQAGGGLPERDELTSWIGGLNAACGLIGLRLMRIASAEPTAIQTGHGVSRLRRSDASEMLLRPDQC